MGDAAERISCLMVTRPSPDRFELFKRSVACFRAQTYPDRDLVVVLDQGSPEDADRVKDHLAGLGDVVTVVQPPTKHTLGGLRNLSVEAASGAVVCPWDDDDLSHPTRLAEQYGLLRRAGALAVGLQEVLHLFVPSHEMYWTNFRNATVRCHTGTLMFYRGVHARFPESGPSSSKGEDVALLHSLEAEGKVVHLAGAPHLYVYVYHGANTMDREHHRMLARALSISRGLLVRRRSVFEQLACFDLGEHAIDVIGNNGPAFQIPGRRGNLAAGPDNPGSQGPSQLRPDRSSS